MLHHHSFCFGSRAFVRVARRVLLLAAFGALVLGSSFPARADQQPGILFIGDSHTVGTFGKKQDTLLRATPGFRVATYGSCGSSPHSWFEGLKTNCGYVFKGEDGNEERGKMAPTPFLANLLAKHKPRYTIVALGANMYGAPLDWVERSAGQMAQMITQAGSQCIWLGPPHGRNKPEPGLSQLFDTIKVAVSPHCLLVDSRNFTTYPASGGDGVHFDSLGAEGRRIAEGWAVGTYGVFKPCLKAD